MEKNDKPRLVTRRELLKITGGAAGLLLAAACSPSAPTAAPTQAPAAPAAPAPTQAAVAPPAPAPAEAPAVQTDLSKAIKLWSKTPDWASGEWVAQSRFQGSYVWPKPKPIPQVNWDIAKAAAPYKGLEIKINFYAGYPNTDMYQQFSSQFEQLTGIKAKADFVNYGEAIEKHMTLLSSGSDMYDLYMIDSIYLPQYQPFIMDMEQFLADSKLVDSSFLMEDMLKGVQTFWKLNGKTYGFSDMFCFACMFGNRAYFKEASIEIPAKTYAPKLDEYYLDWAKKLTAPGKHYGITESGSRTGIGDEVYNNFWGQGGHLFDEHLRVRFKKGGPDFDKMVHVLKDYGTAYQNKWVPPGATDFEIGEAGNDQANGNSAASWNWSLIAKSLADPATSKIANDIFTFMDPRDDPKATRYMRQGTTALGIAKKSKHPEAAFLYAQWWAHPKTRRAFNEAGEPDPTRYSLLFDPNLRPVYEHYDILRATAVDDGPFAMADRPVPKIPEWSQMEDLMAVHFQGAMIGKESPEDAANGAASDMEDALAVKGYYQGNKTYSAEVSGMGYGGY